MSNATLTYRDLDLWDEDLRRWGAAPDDRIFKRDALEVEVETPAGPLAVWVCHFKSMTDGRDRTMGVRRAEARAVRRLIERRFGDRVEEANWAIVGDLNDYRDRLRLERTADGPLAMQAVQLLKDEELAEYRINIEADSMAALDWAAERDAAVQFMQGLGAFISQVAPMAQQVPGAAPVLLSLLQWSVSKFRVSTEIEGVLDQAIAGLKQTMGQPKPPDPMQQAIVAENGSVMLRRAALRTWLGRLDYNHFPRDAQLTILKDHAFSRLLLEHHIAHAKPMGQEA